jgi:hypothetical protein
MSVVIDGATGVTAPAFDGAVDAADLTGNVAAARITTALNATGSAPIYACRAWVNFNGTGTVSIRASGNVSSITDNGVGDYTINLATAMPDADYVVCGTQASSSATGYVIDNSVGRTRTTSAAQIATINSSGTATQDPVWVNVAIFR